MNEIMNSFKHNLPAKILSVLAAAVLWVLVMNEQNPAINSSYTVPVIVTNQPDNVKVTLRTGEVQLKVRAQRSMIAMYNAEDFKAYVDLSSCEMGDNTMKVYTVLPSGCELLELSDETILVNVDPLINKYIPIRTIVTGKVADGMVAAELQPAENQVSVYGPKSHVDKIVNVNAHVKLNDETSDFRTYAITTPVDADGNEIEDCEPLALPDERMLHDIILIFDCFLCIHDSALCMHSHAHTIPPAKVRRIFEITKY